MSTTAHTALYTLALVRDETVDEGPCPQCDDVDAFIQMNLYVREWGQTTRFVECCVSCGQRIALEERAAEVLIEVPASLYATVADQLTNH